MPPAGLGANLGAPSGATLSATLGATLGARVSDPPPWARGSPTRAAEGAAPRQNASRQTPARAKRPFLATALLAGLLSLATSALAAPSPAPAPASSAAPSAAPTPATTAPAPASSIPAATDSGTDTVQKPALPQAQAQRLVTLGGPVTEIVYALGAEAEIIATDRTSLYPARAQKLPSVGIYRALSAEGVLGMNPSKILSGSGIGPEAAVKQLRAGGAPLVIIQNPRSPETLFAAIAQLGSEVRREKEAAALAAKIRAELDSAKAASTGKRKARVVFLMGMAGVASAAGAETQANGIIEMAGGENLFARFRGYKPVSEEAVLQAAPDVILIASHSSQGDVAPPKDGTKFLKKFGFRALGAQSRIKVVPVDMGEFLIIGPRAGQCALKLAKIFYGEPEETKAVGKPTSPKTTDNADEKG